MICPGITTRPVPKLFCLPMPVSTIFIILLLLAVSPNSRRGRMPEIKTREGEAKNCARMILAATYYFSLLAPGNVCMNRGDQPRQGQRTNREVDRQKTVNRIRSVIDVIAYPIEQPGC